MKKFFPAFFLLLLFTFPPTAFGQLSKREEREAKREEAWQFFLSHLEEQLTDSNQSEQVYSQRLGFYDSLTNQKTEAGQIRLVPLRFQMIEWPNGNTFFVLFARPNIVTIPGHDGIMIHSFGVGGGEYSRSGVSFRSRRYAVLDVKVEQRKFAPFPVIQISLKGKSSQARVAAVFLGLKNDEWVIVRLEDENGKILSNDYRENSPSAIDYESRTTPPALVVLDEADPVSTLKSLLWLGGIHDSPEKETIPFIKLARNSPDVRKKLEALTSSKSPWIREAAQLALSPPKSEEEQ